MSGFLFGIPRKLIKRITEIEIDTHYYDNDVVPSNQDIFTYTIDTTSKLSTVTGLKVENITTAVMPYRIKYGNDLSSLWATVEYIKNGAFENNTSLIDMTIPNTINTIPSKCFKNCTSLSRVNISKAIHTIDSEAFSGCSNLRSIFIPFTVNNIATDAFKNCNNLKIICYKNSVAETYAKEHNIPYSLISYTLDDEVTQNSQNLVTSGSIFSFVKKHLDNIINPHDNSTFKNTNLTGITNILKGRLNQLCLTTRDELINNKKAELLIKYPNKDNINSTDYYNYSNELNDYVQNQVNSDVESYNDLSLVNKGYVDNSIKNITVGTGFQTVNDDNLKTSSKNVVNAINEVNDKLIPIQTRLVSGWNIVSLERLFPVNWAFVSKPYCYTDDGYDVEYNIRNFRNNVVNNNHAFEIYTNQDCNCDFAVTATNFISGYPMDYVILSYYYTGADGKDLDTVTEITNTNWTLSKTVGYGHSHEISSNGITYIKFGGDNTSGGSENANVNYYETIYLNIKEMQALLPDEDIIITLYGTWYSSKGNGHINVSMDCYTCNETPSINVDSSTKIITLSGNNLQTTYQSNSTMQCNVVTIKGNTSNYSSTYTPTFRITIKKMSNSSNYRTISIESLS